MDNPVAFFVEILRRLEGIGCNPAVVFGTREDFMTGMGRARMLDLLPFPEKNGPLAWPQYTIRKAVEFKSPMKVEHP